MAVCALTVSSHLDWVRTAATSARPPSEQMTYGSDKPFASADLRPSALLRWITRTPSGPISTVEPAAFVLGLSGVAPAGSMRRTVSWKVCEVSGEG